MHLPVSVGAVRGFLKGGGEGESFFFFFAFFLKFGVWGLESGFLGGVLRGGFGGDGYGMVSVWYGVFYGPFTILSGSLGVRHRFRIGYCIN